MTEPPPPEDPPEQPGAGVAEGAGAQDRPAGRDRLPEPGGEPERPGGPEQPGQPGPPSPPTYPGGRPGARPGQPQQEPGQPGQPGSRQPPPAAPRPYGPTYGPTHAPTYGPLYPPTPPFGVQQPGAPYGPPPPRQPMSPGVKVLIGVAVVFAILVASWPILGMVHFITSWGSSGEPTVVVTATSPPGAASPAPQPARSLTADEWAAIARDPAGHRGERIRVAGRITRLWSADDGTARAAVGGSPSAGDPTAATPVALTGSERAFRSVRVEDEPLLRAVVEGENAEGMPVLRVEGSSALRTG